jgi:tetratricopeptide (TPR) repeat protein
VLSIVVALLSGIVVAAAFRLTHVVHTTAGAITPGVIALVVVAILLFRRIGKLINPVVEEAQRHMQGGRVELALKSLKEALTHKAWHPMLEPQLRTQIGLIHYMQGDVDEALPELEKGGSRPWESPAYLGCAYFKKHNEAGMVKAFEKAVKIAPKEPLAYTVYAWCLVARGKKAEAAAVLKRGLDKLPQDERIKANLELVAEGKKMKVAPYGDRWTRFLLDGGKPGVPKQMRGFAQRPGFRQRPQRKK